MELMASWGAGLAGSWSGSTWFLARLGGIDNNSGWRWWLSGWGGWCGIEWKGMDNILLILMMLMLMNRWLGSQHWRQLIDQVRGDGRCCGQGVHGRSWHIQSWSGTLLQHKGEHFTGRTVHSQLAAIDALADIVLRVAEVSLASGCPPPHGCTAACNRDVPGTRPPG